MSNDKIGKTNNWKNFIGFGALVSIICGIFIFQIPIHFSVFENIGVIPSNFLILSYFLIGLIIVIVILIVIYKISKNRIEKEVKKENELL